MNHPPDPDLTRFADTGDEAAFGSLAERFTGMVYSCALRRTNSPEAAEEIVQRVFTALRRLEGAALGEGETTRLRKLLLD